MSCDDVSAMKVFLEKHIFPKMNSILFLNLTERKTNFAAKSITMICSPAVFNGIKRADFNTIEMG